ncbi:hypothetical protein PPYR_15677, partial [Photinus pyralis]
MSNKFDGRTRRDWEAYRYRNELPDMEDMRKFLNAKCDVLETIELSKSEKSKPNSQTVQGHFKKQVV